MSRRRTRGRSAATSRSPGAAAGRATARRDRPADTPRLPWTTRRHLLRHFEQYADDELAAVTDLSPGQVRAFLESRGAHRTEAQRGRIAKRGPVAAPAPWTPARVREVATRAETRPLDRLDALLLLLMFSASLVLYALTAAHTVTGEDAGELLAAAHGLGVPHPPGYPLWTLLAHGFDRLLPWGTTAWRVSLLSGVTSAAANTVLLAIALKTLRHRAAAWTGAALFAVSLTHWLQAVIPEVYGLNSLLLLSGVLLLVRLRERASPRRLATLAAVCGLGLANHTSAVPVAAVLAVGAVLVAPQLLRRPAVVAGAVIAGLLPLLLYAYLPWASARDPYLDWGNPETLDAFVAHVSRAQYASLEEGRLAAADYASYLERLGVLAASMAEQFGSPWVLLAALVGFYAMAVRQPGPWIVLLAMGWLCTIGITQYSNFSLDREHVYANRIFFIPAWATLAWLVAGGLDTLLLGLRRGRALRASKPAMALCGLGVLLALLPAARHLPRADRSGTTLVADYGKALLDGMGPGALYIPSSDHGTFPVLYWQAVHGLRPDVVVADKCGGIEVAVAARVLSEAELRDLARLSAGERNAEIERRLVERWPGPVYFSKRRLPGDVDRLLEPAGLLFQSMTPEEAAAWWAPADDGGAPPGLAAWDALAHLDLEGARDADEFSVQLVRAGVRYMKGLAQLKGGREEAAFATWAAIDGDLAPLKQVLNNVGSALADLGRADDAYDFFLRALDEDPDYVLALRNAATVLVTMGRHEEALAHLDRALHAEPDARPIRVDRDRVLAHLNERIAALAADAAAPPPGSPWQDALPGHAGHVSDGDELMLLQSAVPHPPTPQMPGGRTSGVVGAPVPPDPVRDILPDLGMAPTHPLDSGGSLP